MGINPDQNWIDDDVYGELEKLAEGELETCETLISP